MKKRVIAYPPPRRLRRSVDDVPGYLVVAAIYVGLLGLSLGWW